MNQIKFIREHIDRPELLALLAEELVEASHAALKLRRAIMDADPTPVTEDKAYNKLIEELGDISAVLEVLGLNSGMVRMKVEANKVQKLARWVERLKQDGDDHA